MKTLAKDIMSTEVLAIVEGTPIVDALKLLVNHRITGMPVVDKAGKMVGVISEYDIILQLSKHLTDRQSLRVELFEAPFTYTSPAKAVKTTTSLSAIVKTFVKDKNRRLPVVDENGKLVGIITRRDLIRIFYYRSVLK